MNGRIRSHRSSCAGNAVMRLKGRLFAGVIVGIWFTCAGLSFASVETRWVPIGGEYQTPSLRTVYVDPDSIGQDRSVVGLRQLTDYVWMQGNAGFGRFGLGPHRFFSTVTAKNSIVQTNVCACSPSPSFHTTWEPVDRQRGMWTRVSGFVSNPPALMKVCGR